MTLAKETNWERIEDGSATRFICTVIDVNGRVRKVRLARNRIRKRKAVYGWRLRVEGFGDQGIGYYKDNEEGAKRCAQSMLDRMVCARAGAHRLGARGKGETR